MFLLSLGAILSFNAFLLPSSVDALEPDHSGDEETIDTDYTSCSKYRTWLVFRSWDYGLDHREANGRCHVIIPGNTENDKEAGANSIPTFVWTIVLNVFFDISIVAGLLAVVMIIFNGIQYMTSGGSADKVSNAKKGLTQSIIGLVITILAATIINFIVGLF